MLRIRSMLRRPPFALAVCALAAGGAAAAKAPKPRLAGPIGRPLVGSPKTVTVKARATGPPQSGSAVPPGQTPGAARGRRSGPRPGDVPDTRALDGRRTARQAFLAAGHRGAARRGAGRAGAVRALGRARRRAPARRSCRRPDLRVDLVTGQRTVVAAGFDQPIAWPSTAPGGYTWPYTRDLPRRCRRPGSRRRERDARPYGDGGPATAASLAGHGGFTFLPDGRMAIAEYDGCPRGAHRRHDRHDRRERNEGYAGDGGSAAAAIVRHPHDVEALADGTILPRTATTRDPAIGPDGRIRTVVSSLSALVDLAAAPGGGFVIGDAAGTVYRIAADGAQQVALRAQRGPDPGGRDDRRRRTCVCGRLRGGDRASRRRAAA